MKQIIDNCTPKVAIITDSHFYNGFPFSSYNENGVSSRLNEISNVHLDFVKRCVKYGVTHIFHGGDLYHTINPTQLERYISYQWIDLALANGIKLCFVPGNHDSNLLIHTLSLFERKHIVSDLITVLNEPTVIQFSNCNVLAIPFLPSVLTKPLYKVLLELDENDIVFGHVSTDTCVSGVELSFNERDPIILDSDVLNQCQCQFLFGHIHDKQKFFLGAPTALNFGDKSSNKYYWLDGEFVKTDCAGFFTIKVDLEIQTLEYELNKVTDKHRGYLRIMIENADQGYKIPIDMIKEILPSHIKYVKSSIERKEIKSINRKKGVSVSFKDSLDYYHVTQNVSELQKRFDNKFLNRVKL